MTPDVLLEVPLTFFEFFDILKINIINLKSDIMTPLTRYHMEVLELASGHKAAYLLENTPVL